MVFIRLIIRSSQDSANHISGIVHFFHRDNRTLAVPGSPFSQTSTVENEGHTAGDEPQMPAVEDFQQEMTIQIEDDEEATFSSNIKPSSPGSREEQHTEGPQCKKRKTDNSVGKSLISRYLQDIVEAMAKHPSSGQTFDCSDGSTRIQQLDEEISGLQARNAALLREQDEMAQEIPHVRTTIRDPNRS